MQITAPGTFHVWSLGGGVTVELRSSAPLSGKHLKRLLKYVALAAETEEDEDSDEARLHGASGATP